MQVVGRRAELVWVGRLVDDLETGRGSVAVLAGVAGIGKTTVLAAARRAVEERGVSCVAARGHRLEAAYAFGVARQALEPLALGASPERRDELFAGPARLAEEALGNPGQATPAVEQIVHALHWFTVNATGDRALVVIVDDVQWADAPSAGWLAYLAARIEDLPLLLLCGVRSGESVPEAVAELLASADRTRELGPLRLEDTALIIGAALGSNDEEFARACHDRSGGNPLVLQRLVAELAERGVAPGPESARLAAGLIPASVLADIGRQLDGLGSAAAATAAATTVLGSEATLATVGETAGLELNEVLAAIEVLRTAGLLARGSELRIAHPLFEEAILGQLGPERRSALFRRSAEVLHAKHASAEAVAAQLLPADSRGEAWAVDVLRSAAKLAGARGAPEIAGRLLARALEEPPASELRATVLREHGEALGADDPRRAIDVLAEALRISTDGRERALSALALGRALGAQRRTADAVDVLAEAAAAVADENDELALELECELVSAGLRDSTTRAFARATLERRLPTLSSTGTGRRLLAEAAFDAAFQRRAVEEVSELLDRAGIDRPLPESWTADASAVSLIATATYTGHLDRAHAMAVELEARAVRAGSMAAYVIATDLRAMVALARGDVREAEAAVEASLGSGDRRWELGRAWTWLTCAQTLCRLDRAEEGLDRLAQAGYMHPPADHISEFPPVLCAQATVLTAVGRPAEGLGIALDWGRREEDLGIDRAGYRWRPVAAQAALAAGDKAKAHDIAAEEHEHVAVRNSPLLTGVADALRGAAIGGLEGAAVLEDAVATLEPTPFLLARADALLLRGRIQRHARRLTDARESLRVALDLAYRCGAVRLTREAREELVLAGGRPRRMAMHGGDALTPAERRVAELVAAGRTNPEVAQALFVTRKTVEKHLGSIYMKLDIRRREDLADALAPKQ